MLVILPFTYREANSSWEAGSLQSLLHSDAMVKLGKLELSGGHRDSSVPAVLGSHSEASPVEGWKWSSREEGYK